MDESPRHKLCEIIRRYGASVFQDTRRCEGLIRDLCGNYRREINVMVVALRDRVPHDLLSATDAVPDALLLARLTRRLLDNHGLGDEFASWAVQSWALALGKISIRELEMPASTAPVQSPPVVGPSRGRGPTTDLSTLRGKAANALQFWQLVGLANCARSPNHGWILTQSAGWNKRACGSVKALSKIYSEFGQNDYTDAVRSLAPNIHEALCLCECHRGLNSDDGNCGCCTTYSQSCFCECHYCESCDSESSLCGGRDVCDCECHANYAACENCAGNCYCQCHGCADCSNTNGRQECDQDCDCGCHPCCDECLSHYEAHQLDEDWGANGEDEVYDDDSNGADDDETDAGEMDPNDNW
jgi:hypothetical protein